MQEAKGHTEIEQLQARMDMMAAQIASLSADNEALARENRRLSDEARRWRSDYDRLLEQIKQMNCYVYGSRSEKSDPSQLSLFNDVEACAAPSAAEPSLEPAQARPRRRGGRRVLDLDALETVVVDHELPEGERACPECGAEMSEMKVEVTRRVRLVPAHLVVEEHRRRVYICRDCSSRNAEDGSVPAVIVRAPAPEPPIPGSFATPSLIAGIINSKYANSMPLYRIEADFRTLGARISRQDMANWVIGAHERWLARVHARMREHLLGRDLLHADETPVQVLREPGREAKRKSYVWLFRTASCDTPICVYEYTETRAGRNARAFLRGWSGTLVTDGYPPYFSLGPNVTNVACLAHARRKFAAIVKAAGGDARVSTASASTALEGRRRIDAMFALDAALSELPPDERRAAREERLRPMMESFAEWAAEERSGAVPRMALAKALDYALKYWPYVMNALADGRVELSNNIAERTIRPFVIGRKNWLFSDTPRGAAASCAIYSIVVTAKANGVKPREYVEWLLEEMPNTSGIDDPGVLDRFMPWSEAVPDSCRMTPAQAARAAEMPDDPILNVDPEAFDED